MWCHEVTYIAGSKVGLSRGSSKVMSFWAPWFAEEGASETDLREMAERWVDIESDELVVEAEIDEVIEEINSESVGAMETDEPDTDVDLNMVEDMDVDEDDSEDDIRAPRRSEENRFS